MTKEIFEIRKCADNIKKGITASAAGIAAASITNEFGVQQITDTMSAGLLCLVDAIRATMTSPIVTTNIIKALNYQITDIIKSLYSDDYINRINGTLSAILDNLIKEIPSISDEIIENVKNIDFNNISVNETDKSIAYDGNIYTDDKIKSELSRYDKELPNIKTKKDFIYFTNKHPLFYAILLSIIIPTLFIVVPNQYESNKFEIKSTLTQNTQYGYIIADYAIVRENSNPRSKALLTLQYDDEIIIVDSIPRWYRIQVIQDDNSIIEGYIAKKNVDY